MESRLIWPASSRLLASRFLRRYTPEINRHNSWGELLMRPCRFRSAAALAAVLVAATALSSRAAEPLLEKTDLFTAGTAGYALYRIPGVVVTAKGTLLAYCEARKSASGDWGTIDVLMRRSTDGGKTWSEARRIVTPPADAKPNPLAVELKHQPIYIDRRRQQVGKFLQRGPDFAYGIQFRQHRHSLPPFPS